jgi:hypothetical protein
LALIQAKLQKICVNCNGGKDSSNNGFQNQTYNYGSLPFTVGI